MNYNEKNDLFGQLLTIKNKLTVIKYLDAEVTEVKNVPNEVKELIFGVKESAVEISKLIEICINTMDTSISKDD